MKYRPIKDCFKLDKNIRAQHLLFEDFKEERTDIAKFHFYLWLQDNEFKAPYGKDEKGNFGYGLKYISNL